MIETLHPAFLVWLGAAVLAGLWPKLGDDHPRALLGLAALGSAVAVFLAPPSGVGGLALLVVSLLHAVEAGDGLDRGRRAAARSALAAAGASLALTRHDVLELCLGLEILAVSRVRAGTPSARVGLSGISTSLMLFGTALWCSRSGSTSLAAGPGDPSAPGSWAVILLGLGVVARTLSPPPGSSTRSRVESTVAVLVGATLLVRLAGAKLGELELERWRALMEFGFGATTLAGLVTIVRTARRFDPAPFVATFLAGAFLIAREPDEHGLGAPALAFGVATFGLGMAAFALSEGRLARLPAFALVAAWIGLPPGLAFWWRWKLLQSSAGSATPWTAAWLGLGVIAGLAWVHALRELPATPSRAAGRQRLAAALALACFLLGVRPDLLWACFQGGS